MQFRFWTSKETLLWIPDTFFSKLLSERFSSIVDDEGAVSLRRNGKKRKKDARVKDSLS